MSLTDKNSKPIVHIATDEKFIDAAYDIYEKAFPAKNLFLILSNDDQAEIKYVSKEKDYYFINSKRNYFEKVQGLTSEACLIVFHGMSFQHAELAQNLDKHDKKFLWTVFGEEVYNNHKNFKKESIGEKTYKKFIFSYLRFIKIIVKPYYYKFVKSHPNEVQKELLKKVDYVGVLYEEELNKYKELQIVKSDIDLIRFTYYPLELVIEIEADFVKADHILLGNSASYTNNHLEAFEILEKFDLDNHEIISALSYGSKEYANQIIEIGNQKFGENFKPLTEFLSLSDYQKILENCGIVIMNHYRQQAVGNVLNAIYVGAKVYLSYRNTLYHYLKRIGCHVFCIEEDLVPENRTAFNLLAKSQMIDNRGILKDELSLERIVKELQKKLNPIIK